MIPTQVRIFVCTERQDMRLHGAAFELPESRDPERPLATPDGRAFATLIRGVPDVFSNRDSR